MLMNVLFLFSGCAMVHSLSVSGDDHTDDEYFSPDSIVGLHGMTDESPHHHNHKRKAKMNVDQVLVSESGHSNVNSKNRLFNTETPNSVSRNNEHSAESVQTQIHHGYGSGSGNSRSEGSSDLINVWNTQADHKKITKPGTQIEEGESFYHDDAYGGSEGSNFDKMRFNHGALEYWSDGSDWGKTKDRGSKHEIASDSHHSQSNTGVAHYDTAVTCTCTGGVARKADCMKDKPEWCESCNTGQPVRLILGGLVQAFCGWTDDAGDHVDPTLLNVLNVTDPDDELPSRGPIAVSSLPDIGHHAHGHTSEYSGHSYHAGAHNYYFTSTAHNASDHTHYYYY